MEYALLFAFMGTLIAWLLHRNRELNRQLQLSFLMMNKMVEGEVTIIKKENGFDLIIKGE